MPLHPAVSLRPQSGLAVHRKALEAFACNACGLGRSLSECMHRPFKELRKKNAAECGINVPIKSGIVLCPARYAIKRRSMLSNQ